MMQSAGIVVNDVTVTWRNGHTALRDASFTVPGGSIAALVGVNGSGKSTLFKAIMGFVRLTSGKISVLGIPTRQALQKNLVAYVPQSEEVDWSFPVLVEDVVMMGRYGHMGMLRIAKKRDRQIVTDALERVDMVDFRHRQIGELSGGQKKRVFLARAIAQQGDVILLDEPFTGVDVKTEAKIISLLRELRAEGKTMLVSTHNLGSVTTFCDYTVMVKGPSWQAGRQTPLLQPRTWSWLLAAYCAMSHLTARKKALLLTMNALLWHIDRQRCRGKKDERATGTLQL